MNTKQFLKVLENKLQELNEKERKEIIDNYKNKIELGKKQKMKVKDIIKDFGDVDLLCQKILKQNKEIVEKNAFNFIEEKINFVLNYIFKNVNKYFKIIKKENTFPSLFIDICTFVILLLILRFPFFIFKLLGVEISYLFSSPIKEMFVFNWILFLETIYVLFYILITIVFVKNRFLVKKDSIVKKEVVKKEPDVLLIVIKIILIFMLIPFLSIITSLAIICGMLVWLMINGVYLFGFFSVVVGLLIIFGSLVDLIFMFLKGGNKNE